jgi:hypothetical protein
MWFLLACADPAPPDPDTLLRQGKLEEALSAWEAAGGRHISATHPTAHTLAVRAASEPWITVPVLADFTEAAAVLDGVPTSRTEPVDLSFEAWGPLADCTTAALTVPWRVVVGRSSVAADADPLETGRPFENVPYSRGRVVGMGAALTAGEVEAGREAVRKLFAGLDKDPPAHRVTLVLVEPANSVAVNLTRKDGVWWTTAATEAARAADWVVRCGAPK